MAPLAATTITPVRYAPLSHAHSATDITSGTLSDVRLSANVALLNANQTYPGANTFTNSNNVFVGSFVGQGAGLTNLDAASLGGGTVSDARLSTNVALLNGNQTFTGANVLTNPANVFAGSFSGQATGLTDMDAANLTSGTVPDARLSANVALLNSSPQFNGSVQAAGFTGDGSGLTSLKAEAVGPTGTFSVPRPLVPASTPAVGSSPTSVAAADLNGDGRVDLICANFAAQNTVTVVTNKGQGEFGWTQAPLIGTRPRGVTVADVNADGWPDVISANATTNTLTVLTNNHRGHLVAAGSPKVGAGPWAVAAADINSDGTVDLISADAGTNTLTVLTNDGTGSFTAASTNTAGSTPHAVAVADFDGDGRLDLVSADNIGGTLSMLRNDGTGGFVRTTTYSVSAYPESVIAADMNQDGRMDLISVGQGAASGSGSLFVLTNAGAGNFEVAFSKEDMGTTHSVATVDFNGDGWPDLVAPDSTTDMLSVLTNDQHDSFVLASTASVGHQPYDVIATDVNGDGRMDLVTANYGNYSLSVLLNGGSGVSAHLNEVAAQSFTGNGVALTNLNASHLTSGTIAESLLPANLAWLEANQTFTGANAFNNPGNSYAGDGSALTGLNAAHLTTGTVPDGRLAGTYSSAVTFNDPANSFSGNGTYLTSLNAGHLAVGTVPNARLSGDIPRLSASQTFTGTATFNPASGAPFTVGTTNRVPDLNADLLDGLNSGSFWKLGGNSGTTAGTDFLGTTDDQPLELKVNNVRALRLERAADSGVDSHVVNVIAGSPDNVAAASVLGATVSGGGTEAMPNVVRASLGTIGGGKGNTVQPDAITATITGGVGNMTSAEDSFVGGGQTNLIATGAHGASIAGGRFNTVGADASCAAIAGGSNNVAGATASFLGGGQENAIESDCSYATLGGGNENVIQANAAYTVLGGGRENAITNAYCAFVGGGFGNTNEGDYAVVGGGQNNVARGAAATVAGGRQNEASGYRATVGGGYGNVASNYYPVVSGGYMCVAGGYASAVAGGYRSAALGDYSFTAGSRAKATNMGAFVWGDATALDVVSTNDNSVTMRAHGGYRLFTSTSTSGAYLASGSGSWSSMSDRNAKENITPVNPKEVLDKVAELPVATWNYKTQSETTRHLGPMAQDFYAAFGVGEGNTTITTVDADGVALAAIQGLNQVVKEKEARIEALEQENQSLETRLDALEQLIKSQVRTATGGNR